MSFLQGYKTYIISGLLVLVSLVHLVNGEMTLVQFLNSPDLLVLLNGLGLAALRNSVQ